MSECTHNLIEREEAATVDGLCPLCLQSKLDRYEKMAERLEPTCFEDFAAYAAKLEQERDDALSRLDEAQKELEYFQPAFEQTNEQLVRTARELDDARSRLDSLRQLAADLIHWHSVMAYSEPDLGEAAHVEKYATGSYATWVQGFLSARTSKVVQLICKRLGIPELFE